MSCYGRTTPPAASFGDGDPGVYPEYRAFHDQTLDAERVHVLTRYLKLETTRERLTMADDECDCDVPMDPPDPSEPR